MNWSRSKNGRVSHARRGGEKIRNSVCSQRRHIVRHYASGVRVNYVIAVVKCPFIATDDAGNSVGDNGKIVTETERDR